MSESSPPPTWAVDLVDANHILFHQGVVDAFGHVSVRDKVAPDRFWLSRSKAPMLVEVDDLMCFDLDGEARDDERHPYLERFIHAGIYRARSDVMAVVHSHSPSLVPFGIVDVGLKPVCHMCGFIGDRTPVFEIRECVGTASDLLIRSPQLGMSLAVSLGDENVVLMRGHGVTVVGTSLRQAVFRAVYTELNARLQAEAMRLSSRVTYLTPEEGRAASATNDAQIDRAWELWREAASSR